jgi:F0F1-type ATP synthase membrane subunit b/b'
MVRILSTLGAALAVAVLLEPTSAARTDEDPHDVPVEADHLVFDDLLAPENEESKVRPLVYPEAREAKEATMVATMAADRANEATQKARQQANIAQSAMDVSQTQAAEAKAAMVESQNAGRAAKASGVRAHLEQAEAAATQKISAFDKEATAKMEEETRTADKKVSDVMHEAEVKIHQSKLDTDHGIKESETTLAHRTKELDDQAAKKIQEIEHEATSVADEKIKDIQMRATTNIQHAKEASFQRIKHAEEQAERDISTVHSENAAVLRSKAEHVLKINNDADVQVKKTADYVAEGLVRVEEHKKRIVEKGQEAMELSLKENTERTDNKVKASADALMRRLAENKESIFKVNEQANLTITQKNAETKTKIERFEDTAAQNVKANEERYTTDSQEVANLRTNQVKEHEAVMAQATYQEKRVTKQVADRKEEKDSTGKAFQDAEKVAEEAKEAAGKARSDEIDITRESKHSKKVLDAELAAAAAQQKAKDSAAYAAKTRAISVADRLAVTNARTNPLLQSGVPYGGWGGINLTTETLSDPVAVDGNATSV